MPHCMKWIVGAEPGRQCNVFSASNDHARGRHPFTVPIWEDEEASCRIGMRARFASLSHQVRMLCSSGSSMITFVVRHCLTLE